MEPLGSPQSALYIHWSHIYIFNQTHIDKMSFFVLRFFFKAGSVLDIDRLFLWS